MNSLFDSTVTPVTGAQEFMPEPDIDLATMSCRFRICTPRLDRENDVIEPSGIDHTDYRHNPAVFFDHAAQIPFPVARSADADGRLSLEYDSQEDALYGRAYFSEKHDLSAQVFGLIEEGFLKACSVHVKPVWNAVTETAQGGDHVHLSTMLEYSVCGLGCNPDAYLKSMKGTEWEEAANLQLDAARRILEASKVGGRDLNATLAKTLRAAVPQNSQTILRGHTMEKSLNSERVSAMTSAELMGAFAELSQYDANTQGLLRAKAKQFAGEAKSVEAPEAPPAADATPAQEVPPAATDVAPEPADASGSVAKNEEEEAVEEVVEETAEAVADLPPGAELLSEVHDAMAMVADMLENASSRTENSAVVELASTVVDSLREVGMALEGGFGEIYPDAQLAKMGGGEDEDKERRLEWAAKSANQLKLSALVKRLESVGEGLEGAAKKVVDLTRRDLQLLHTQAKNWKPESATEVAELNEKVKTLTEERDRYQKAANKIAEKFKKQEAPLR